MGGGDHVTGEVVGFDWVGPCMEDSDHVTGEIADELCPSMGGGDQVIGEIAVVSGRFWGVAMRVYIACNLATSSIGVLRAFCSCFRKLEASFAVP